MEKEKIKETGKLFAHIFPSFSSQYQNNGILYHHTQLFYEKILCNLFIG